MISAVIYDMDGLIIDSEPAWRQAEVQVFGQFGVQLTETDCLQTTGLKVDEVVEYWAARFPQVASSRATIAEGIRQRVLDALSNKGVEKPGAIASMRYFADLGLPLALASGSEYVIIDCVLAKLGLQDIFQAVVSSQDHVLGKPHPAVFLDAAERLSVPAQKCLVLEDSVNGVIAAKAARMQCWAIPEPCHQSNPRFVLADRILGSLHECQECM